MTDEELIGLMASAMAASKAHDEEGEFDMLCDLIGFSGENKTRTVLKEAARAALAVAAEHCAQIADKEECYSADTLIRALANPE